MNIVAGYGAVHLVQYQPAQRQYRDHFVAHECGHLIRFYTAAPQDRIVPISNRQHRRAVAQEIEEDLMRLHGQGLSEEALGELLTMWHEGLVRQLTNYPADMRIERWLKSNYPGLDEPQERSIRHQLRENEQVLGRSVKDFTPSKVYDASASMNAGFAQYMSLLYEDNHLGGPHSRTPYWDTGRRLAEQVWSSKDAGYAGDVGSAQEWAQLFGVDGWLEWKHVNDLKYLKR